MNTIEIKAKNVKEAIKLGLEKLGLTDSADAKIEVIEMGSSGIFGMFAKPAIIHIGKKEEEKIDIKMPTLSLEPSTPKKAEKKPAEKKQTEKKPAEAKPVEVKPAAAKPVEVKPEVVAEPDEDETALETETAETGDAPVEKKKRHRSRGKKKPTQNVAEPAEEPQTEAPVEVEPFEETPEDRLTDTAKNARAFLKELTEKMGVPAEIAVCDGEEQLRMVLSGENMSILIGHHGDTLDAIQYLTSLFVNRSREDYLRVSLDTENYRAKREEQLRKLAVRMAGRCKKSGKRVALEPMNPYERRILHSALQNDPDVTTHSEGEDPYRRVIITMK